MKKDEIVWHDNAWTVVQEADAVKHRLEICCRAENGMVVEIRIRHNDGNEEVKATATMNGESVLPIAIPEFTKLFKKGKLEIR